MCCLTLAEERNWQALRIGEMMPKVDYSQTFHGVLLLEETGVPSVEADELPVEA